MKPSPLFSCASVKDFSKKKSIRLIFINHEGTKMVKKIRLTKKTDISCRLLSPRKQTKKVSFDRVIIAASNKNLKFVSKDSLRLSLLQRLFWFSLIKEGKKSFFD